jgi:hypothetical protein
MNANALAKHYERLTPEERFRLILAASGRGDEAERDRLAKSGQRITLSMQDFMPHAHAFDELAFLVFIELLEEAARYLDLFERADEVRDLFGDDEAGDEDDDEGEEGQDGQADAGAPGGDTGKPPVWQRSLDLALAAGFMLRTAADGWKLFCKRLSVPPFLLWEGLPGFDRLQRALRLAEKAAFTAEGFLRWLNRTRPAGEPEATKVAFTVAGMADAAQQLFRQRVEWWGG